jgi:hypothetical protein
VCCCSGSWRVFAGCLLAAVTGLRCSRPADKAASAGQHRRGRPAASAPESDTGTSLCTATELPTISPASEVNYIVLITQNARGCFALARISNHLN